MTEKAQYKCHDCDKTVKVIGDKLKNGVVLVYKDGDEKITVIKCKKCYETNPRLINYRRCEVYSRIVGYLRPIQQWNPGKQEEYKQRKDYKLKK